MKGFAAGAVIGVLIGFGLGHSRILTDIFMPLLNLFNTLPRIALAPLFILWFGIGEQSKVVLVFSVAVVILIFNTYSRDADRRPRHRHQRQVARCWPSADHAEDHFALVSAVDLCGYAKSLSPGRWVRPSSVSILASRAGLGFMIFQYSSIFERDHGVFAGIILLLTISGTTFRRPRHSRGSACFAGDLSGSRQRTCPRSILIAAVGDVQN